MLNKTAGVFLLFFVLISLLSCTDDSQDNSSKNSSESVNKQSTTESSAAKQQPPIDKKHDWDGIVKHGSLRIIVPYSFQHNDFLPRKSVSYNNELKLITRFAEAHNLTPVIVTVKNFSQMLPSLQQGLGDVIIANLTVTESRKEKVNFTHPVTHVFEQLVVPDAFFGKGNSPELLNGLNIGVRPNTSFWETIQAIKEKQNNINIIELDDKITPDEKFNKIISGEIDAAIVDSNRLTLMSEYRSDIKAVLNLSEERPIAWAVRKNNPVLLRHLNRYIKTEKLLQHIPAQRLGDLDSIKKHRQLRLITRNNASTYFLWKNQLMGFEYDLIKKFAKQQKINLKVLVADNYTQMIDWLEHGYGDIISAGLVKTEKRAELPVLFTDPYLFVQEVIIQRTSEEAIKSIKDLNQRTFYVRKSSSYWNTLNTLIPILKSQGIEFAIEVVPESMETEEIIRGVIDGQYDLTLADSHIIAIESSWHSSIQASLPLTGENGHRWIVRKDGEKIIKELNKFIKKQYKGLFYNVTYNKYFKNSRNMFNSDSRESNDTKISAYDDLIKSLAKEYDFDWRLIAAQINKESKFNTKAKSWAGAKGLLQVMPRTAKEVGISNLEKPENGLRAGLKYMAWINAQLSDDLPVDVRVWFTLAAYNAGLGHLKDARSLATRQGLNPDRWFGNVEKTFLLLSKPKHHKKSRYGYVRGIEPVTYVKQIQALYELYSKKHLDEV